MAYQILDANGFQHGTGFAFMQNGNQMFATAGHVCATGMRAYGDERYSAYVRNTDRAQPIMLRRRAGGCSPQDRTKMSEDWIAFEVVSNFDVGGTETAGPYELGTAANVTYGTSVRMSGFATMPAEIRGPPSDRAGFPLPLIRQGVLSGQAGPLLILDTIAWTGMSGGPVVADDNRSQVIGMIVGTAISRKISPTGWTYAISAEQLEARINDPD